MKQNKCFLKIQIPVCRITMQARGFAVWTTPSPRGDWNSTLGFVYAWYSLSEPPPHREVIETPSSAAILASSAAILSELPPHREVIDPNPRYPKKISGIFLCKKLKKLACPGIHSERKSSWENLRKKIPKKLKKPARPGIYSERRWSHGKELLRCSHVPLIFRHSFFKGVFTWTDIFSPLFRRSFMTCGSAIFIPRLSASLTAPLIITNKT